MSYSLQAPPITPAIKFILWGIGFGLLLKLFVPLVAGVDPAIYLSLNFEKIFRGEIHRIFLFWIMPGSFITALFEALLLVFIGGEIHQMVKKDRFIAIVLSAFMGQILLACLFYLLGLGKGAGPIGTDFLSYTLLLFYALMFPQRQLLFFFIFPLKAPIFCGLIALMVLYGSLSGGFPIWGITSLLAPLFPFLLLRFRLLSRLSFSSPTRDPLNLKHWIQEEIRGGLKKKPPLRLIENDKEREDNSKDPKKPTYH